MMGKSQENYSALVIDLVSSLPSVVKLCVMVSADKTEIIERQCNLRVADILRSEWYLVVHYLTGFYNLLAPTEFTETAHARLVCLTCAFPCLGTVEVFCPWLHLSDSFFFFRESSIIRKRMSFFSGLIFGNRNSNTIYSLRIFSQVRLA